MHRAPNRGVSVAICCHNSETLLPTTIMHLKNQRVDGDLKWEVLVIDNACTASTALVARRCGCPDGLVALRVVQEPRLGLSYARERAFDEARYDIVSFIDDDNWVAPQWVTTAWRCMSEDL